MKKILVSACLLGKNVKYNGGNNYNELVISLNNEYEIIPICPEVEGGLPCPRIPSEIKDDKVINKEGIDVSEEFNLGANLALEKAKANNPEFIVLKDGSPSCGVNYIYDGTFTSTKINKMGVTSSLLKKEGFNILSEIDLENKRS